MPQDLVDIPQGATDKAGSIPQTAQTSPVGTPDQKGLVDIPQGATSTLQSISTDIDEGIGPSPAQAYFDTAKNLGVGAAKGLESTIEGGGRLIRKAFGMPQVNNPNRPELQPTGTLEKTGYGGETLLELMLGDEALKGLSQADKLALAAKNMKILEKSPRLMMLLKAGASGARLGGAQAAQTLVRTGDVGEAVKEGGKMAAVAAPLGVIGAGAEAMGKGITKGVESAEKLSQMAAEAHTQPEMAEALRGTIGQSEKDLHAEYDSKINDFKDRLKGEQLDPMDKSLPMSQKAGELLQEPVPSDHPIEAQLKSMLKEGLQPSAKSLLQKIRDGVNATIDPTEETTIKLPKIIGKAGVEPELAGQTVDQVTTNRYQYYKGGKFSTDPITGGELIDMTKLDPSKIDFTSGAYRGALPDEAIIPKLPEYDINNLIGIRQLVRKQMTEFGEKFGWGDTNTRTMKDFLKSVDDTIGKMADEKGDTTLSDEYKQLRANYNDKFRIYDEPFIKNIMNGKYDAKVTQDFLSGRPSLYRVRQLKKIVGPDAMDEVSANLISSVLREATGSSGQTNPAQVMKILSKIPEATRDELFSKGPSAENFQKVIDSAKSARTLQYLSRVGVVSVPALLGGYAGPLYHMGLLGMLLSGVGLGGLAEPAGWQGVRSVIDYIADHPNMWKAWGIVGKATETSGKAAPAIKAAIGHAAATPSPQATKNVYNGAMGLAGTEK